MPVYRAARTLENTYREIPRDCFDDVLVVDDASSDDTVAVARSLGHVGELTTPEDSIPPTAEDNERYDAQVVEEFGKACAHRLKTGELSL